MLPHVQLSHLSSTDIILIVDPLLVEVMHTLGVTDTNSSKTPFIN